VIQGSSFRTKGETPDESSLSRHHFAQTALAASVRAVRHLPETLLEHQQPPLRFPSRLRVRPTACKTPSPRRQSAVSQLQRADLGLESPSYIHSCPFVSIRGSTSPLRFPSRLRVFASSRETNSPRLGTATPVTSNLLILAASNVLFPSEDKQKNDQ
ncbi:MAG: hypothetical protein ACK5YO_33950, partial [Planctomyces sp.]